MEEQKQGQKGPAEELSEFSKFVMSIAAAAMLHLGEMPDPETNECKVNLPLAKHSIDTLRMLQRKTEGNLTQQEKMLLDRILYDLQMKYVVLVDKESK